MRSHQHCNLRSPLAGSGPLRLQRAARRLVRQIRQLILDWNARENSPAGCWTPGGCGSEQRLSCSLPQALMAHSTSARWAVRNGLWTFGVPGIDELAKATEAYTMAGIAGRITCPTLVLDAENDQFFKGQPQRLLDELTCQKELISFREDEGGGEHCHEGAILLFHQRTFDWLDTVLAS